MAPKPSPLKKLVPSHLSARPGEGVNPVVVQVTLRQSQIKRVKTIAAFHRLRVWHTNNFNKQMEMAFKDNLERLSSADKRKNPWEGAVGNGKEKAPPQEPKETQVEPVRKSPRIAHQSADKQIKQEQGEASSSAGPSSSAMPVRDLESTFNQVGKTPENKQRSPGGRLYSLEY